MEEIRITEDIFKKAKKRAKELGVLNNSITSGKGNLVGMLGEELIKEKLEGEILNTYDYDIVLENGYKIEVKTKKTSVAPLPHFECSVASYNTRQKCDFYAFVRIDVEKKLGWILGFYPKDYFYKDARFHKKGEMDGSNNFRFKADCYNLPIQKLTDMPIEFRVPVERNKR